MDPVRADLRAAPAENGMTGGTGLPTEITAASEMRPCQPPANTDPVGVDLRAAHREQHIKAELSSHRDSFYNIVILSCDKNSYASGLEGRI